MAKKTKWGVVVEVDGKKKYVSSPGGGPGMAWTYSRESADALAKTFGGTVVDAEALQRDLAGRHTCHAEGCDVDVPPKMLMCLKHWRRVPKKLQAEIWRTYRPGQEVDKKPSAEYLVAQHAAVQAVAEKEGRV